jgi:acyl-CoA reductase-like NAD-dependent aldehyde dehydrogenase
MISIKDAKRVEQWVDEAVSQGAKVICGGRRHGLFYEATLLENVKPDMKVSCMEVFGPVAVLAPFLDFAEAVARTNASEFGLQAGVFTNDLHHAFYAFSEMEVGGVMINDVPSFRVDSMPYGGVKESGFGREGVRWSMESMTETKLMVLNNAGRVKST